MRALSLLGNQVTPETAAWLVEAGTQTVTVQVQSQAGDDEGSIASSTTGGPTSVASTTSSSITRLISIDLDIPFSDPRSKADAQAEIEAVSYSIGDVEDAENEEKTSA
jgi:hypothetical protein